MCCRLLHNLLGLVHKSSVTYTPTFCVSNVSLKTYLIRKIIDLDLVPCSIKWKKSVSGVGRMYADIMKMMQENYGAEGIEKLSEVMYNIGFNQADEILQLLGLERTLEGCAYVLLAMHRTFGIKSKIVQKDDDKVVIHATHCYWGKRKRGWTPKTCASIEQYETGLVKKILPSATHFYTKRRSLGDNECELTVEQREKQSKQY